MDKIIKNIITNLGSREIGIDEEFKFHCIECGKCCINREDILLNPRDIYNMSKELGISPEEMTKKYCEVYVGDAGFYRLGMQRGTSGMLLWRMSSTFSLSLAVGMAQKLTL